MSYNEIIAIIEPKRILTSQFRLFGIQSGIQFFDC